LIGPIGESAASVDFCLRVHIVAILWQQSVCGLFGVVKRCKVEVQPSFQVGFGPIVETTNTVVNMQPTSNVKSKVEEVRTITEWSIGVEKSLERCL